MNREEMDYQHINMVIKFFYQQIVEKLTDKDGLSPLIKKDADALLKKVE